MLPVLVWTVHSLANPQGPTGSALIYQFSQIGLYLIAIILLFKYSIPIANIIIKPIEDDSADDIKKNTNLLAIFIAGIALYIIVESLPSFMNQVYTFINYYQDELLNIPEKTRFIKTLLSLIGVVLEMLVAFILFIKARKIAETWEDIQNKNQPSSEKELAR